MRINSGMVGGQPKPKKNESERCGEVKSNRLVYVAPVNDAANINLEPRVCRTLQEAFATFEPGVEVQLTVDDTTVSRTLHFRSMSDFRKEGIEAQIPELQRNAERARILRDLRNALRRNQKLRQVFRNPEAKIAIQQCLEKAQALLAENGHA